MSNKNRIAAMVLAMYGGFVFPKARQRESLPKERQDQKIALAAEKRAKKAAKRRASNAQ